MPQPDSIFSADTNVVGVNRLRAKQPVRSLLSGAGVHPSRLIAALLVVEKGEQSDAVLPTTPIDQLPQYIARLKAVGIRGVKLFTKNANKSDDAAEALNLQNLSNRSIEAIKAAAPDICVITDTCLCSYTKNGNCVLDNGGNLDITRSFDILAQHALLQVKAGADVIGPAIMADGAVAKL